MASVRTILLGGALLLALVLQCKAEERFTFDLYEKVQRYVNDWSARMGKPVAWWGTDGKYGYKKGNDTTFKNYGITVTAGPLKYLKSRSLTAQPKVMYTQWIRNNSTEPTKSTLTRKTTHTRTNSWRTEKGFKAGGKLTATAKMPFFELQAEVTKSVDLISGSSESVTETEEFSVMQEITVPPLSSVKVEWIITDYVQEIPWSSEVITWGWMVIALKEKLNGFWFWIESICSLEDPLLERNCKNSDQHGGYVKFTAKGVFVGVKNTENNLHISKHDPHAYGGKPLSVEIIKLPRH